MKITKVRLTTTLKLLRDAGACTDGFRKLKKSLGAKWSDTKPINLLAVLKSNGTDDALWCLRATVQNCDKVARLMAADFAESVLHHFTKVRPNDDRPAKAIRVARDFANGKIDAAARDAAWAAGDAAGAAGDAAGAAWAAARAAARAAGDAARDAESKKQAAIIRKYLK